MVQLTSPTPAVPRRRVEGANAEATWTLHRLRRIERLSDAHAAELIRLTSFISIGGGYLGFRDSVTAIRPSAEATLRRLLVDPLAVVPLAKISSDVYGYPVSSRAVRQAAFRINRAFERVGCPAFVHCHASAIHMRPKVNAASRLQTSPSR